MVDVIEIVQLKASWLVKKNYLLLFCEDKVHTECKTDGGRGQNRFS